MENKKNELVIKHNLDIQSNMEELAVKIQNDIKEKYSLTVTDATVSETKKVMAKINKEKTEFKGKYKEFKTLVLSPFETLDNKAKEIEGYFDEARKALDVQVKKFEEGKREQAKKVCIEYAKKQCEEKNIDFNTITISDLFTKLGSVTAAGRISAAAKKEINSRIEAIELAILKAKQEEEEKAAREREIAEQARIKAEAEAAQREKELLEKAEKEKVEAVAAAVKEVKTSEPIVEPTVIEPTVEEPVKPPLSPVEAAKGIQTFGRVQRPVTNAQLLGEEGVIKTKTFEMKLNKENYFKLYEFLQENNIEFVEIAPF